MLAVLIDKIRQLGPVERRFGAGEHLFHQDDPVRFLHIITEGEAHMVRHHASGSALTLRRAGPGAILAEASLFSDRYHCDAFAVRPTVAQMVAKPAIRARLVEDPDFAEGWAAYLAREVQVMRIKAEILSLRTVAERLDAWIVWNGGQIPARGDWKTVATEIGTSPEALYRELARRRRASG